MQEQKKQPILAESADLLSDRLREFLGHLVVILAPHAGKLERPFLRRLRAQGYGPPERRALLAVSLVEVVRRLAAGESLASFFEVVEFNGRKLAKLNVPPASVVGALGELNQIAEARLNLIRPEDVANFQWVRDQVLFCTILTLNNAYYQVRADEARAFYELSRAELSANSLNELLPGVLQVLEDSFGFSAGALFLHDPEQKRWVMQSSIPADPAGGDNPFSISVPAPLLARLSRPRMHVHGLNGGRLALVPSWHSQYCSCWSVPLMRDGTAVGVIQLAFSKAYRWLPRETEFLVAAAERCWQAIVKTQLLENLAKRERQLREMAERMLQVEEAERRRISCELHDEAGQSLLYIRLVLEMLERSMAGAPADWLRRLRQGREALETTIVEVRRLISALSPAVLEQLGLEAALRQLVSRLRRHQAFRVKLSLSGLGQLPKSFEVILYRLVQECCNNISKHSSASNVNICLTVADGLVRLVVEDDGVGFDLQNAGSRAGSFGLEGLRERVKLIGGSFEITSLPRVGPEGKTGTKTNSRTQGKTGNRNGMERPERSGREAASMFGRVGSDKPGTAVRIEAPIRFDRAS